MSKNWTEKDIEYLKKNYTTKTQQEIAAELEVTRYSVSHKLMSLGLKKRNVHLWTEEDKEYLKKNYDKLPWSEIALKFNVSENAVSKQLQILGLINKKTHTWTPKEVNYLLKNASKVKASDLAKKFNVSSESIRSVIKYYRNKKAKEERRPWESAEIEYLKENYSKLPLEQIAVKLERSTASIRKRVVMLGIKKGRYSSLNVQEQAHLCWKCKYATNKYTGYCSWAHNLTPVKGWETVPRFLGKFKKFVIIKCPLFKNEAV